jgi:sulfate permease, SulP family
MAYATIAGLPVQVGLYTAFVPMVIYAVLGTSRPLSVSTTTTLAILTATELDEVVPSGDPTALLRASAMLTLLVGAILILASLLRLGFIANFISDPVLTGFKAGIGLVIVLDQIPKLMGVHFARGAFVQNLLATVRSIPHLSLATLLLGTLTILLLLALEHWLPRTPAPLIAVAVGIGGTVLLGLPAHGVEVVGYVPPGLPSFRISDVQMAARLWPGALGIALMSFTETIAAGRAFVNRDEAAPQANRELLATGLANAGGALLGAMPAGGGTSQTAVNRMAGARTQVAEMVTGATALLIMLFLSSVIGLMPQATLAAVVIVYSFGLIQAKEFREILAIRRTEFIWAIIAFAGVMLLGTLRGILVAIIMSLLMLAHQGADPPVYVLARKPGTNVFRPITQEHPEDETFPGLLLLRLHGRVYFANVDHIGKKMRQLIEEAKPRVIALDLSGVPDLEYTALKMLIHAEKTQRERGVSLWLVDMTPEVLRVVQRSPLNETLGREAMHFNLETAVTRYQNEAHPASPTAL